MGFSDIQRRVTQTLRKKKSRKFKDGVPLSSRESEVDIPPVPPVPRVPADFKSSVDAKEDETRSTAESVKSNERRVVTNASSATEVEQKHDPNSLNVYHRDLFQHHASSQERIASVGSADYPACPPISRKEAQRPRSMDIPEKQLSEPLPRLSKKAAVRPISADISMIPPVPRIPDRYSRSRSQSGKSDLATRASPQNQTVSPDPLLCPDLEDLSPKSQPRHVSKEPRGNELNATREDVEAPVADAAHRAQTLKPRTGRPQRGDSENSRSHPLLASQEPDSKASLVPYEEGKKSLAQPEPISQAVESTAKSSVSERKGRLKARNASAQTTASDNSDLTVNHDPSKRCSSALTAGVESRFMENFIPNPFADENEVESSPEMSVNGDDQKVAHEVGQRLRSAKQQKQPPVQKIKATPRPEICDSHDEGQKVAPSSAESLEGTSQTTRSRVNSWGSSRSSSSVSRRILEGPHSEKRARKRSKALLSYNTSAQVFGLNALRPDEIPQSVISLRHMDQPVDRHRTNSTTGGPRNAKSTQQLRPKKSGFTRAVRRMRTIASLKQGYPPGSLKGRSLQDIVRLGGESTIWLPSVYSPGRLFLPTSIAATISYIRDMGPSAQHLYVNDGNPGVVHALYHHFAKHILGAVKEKDSIDQTTRSIAFPEHILRMDGHLRRNNDYLYDVTTLLRQLLSEIPDGILGSKYLFHALKQIQGHRFTSAKVDKDPGREEYVHEAPPTIGAKVRMITLALIAMTTDLQLELICAVFGLLSMTEDESAFRDFYHTKVVHPGRPYCGVCTGYPRKDMLASAFGPVLAGFEGADVLHKPTKLTRGPAEDVVIMMITQWKLITLQMRQWGLLMDDDAGPIPPMEEKLPEIVMRCFSCNMTVPENTLHRCSKPGYFSRSAHSSRGH